MSIFKDYICTSRYVLAIVNCFCTYSFIMFVGFQGTYISISLKTNQFCCVCSFFHILLKKSLPTTNQISFAIYLKSNIDVSSKISKILERNIFTFVPSSRNNKENDGQLELNSGIENTFSDFTTFTATYKLYLESIQQIKVHFFKGRPK